jgi:hypothetical protein
VGAVVVVDTPEDTDEARHLDTRLLSVGPRILAADRTLAKAPSGLGARFFVFLPGRADKPTLPPGERELVSTPKVELAHCPTLEGALATAGLSVRVQWIPPRVPWEATAGSDASEEETPAIKLGEPWVALQQSLWARGLNLLVIAPSVFVGLDRHAAFYRDALGFACVDAEREVLAGELSGLRCCALLAALRQGARDKPVVLLIRGDELSRARGGARSLVMPLVREPAEV